MNKDIRGEIYKHLSLEEKFKVIKINDIVLYQAIIDELNETWIYFTYIVPYVRDVPIIYLEKGLRGNDENNKLWEIFMGHDKLLEKILYYVKYQELFKLMKDEYDSEDPKIKFVREKVLNRNSKEEIIINLKKVLNNNYYWVKLIKKN